MRRKIQKLLNEVYPTTQIDPDALEESADPEEPFAGVRVPLSPRPHLDSGAIALALPESDEE
jgi:hypothetical protein